MKTARPRGVFRLAQPVFFIGFMGAGKTSVAQYLAQTCGLASIDADEYLELLEDRSVAAIFAEDGEDSFRDLESIYLRDLAKRSPRFIACGGGVILRPENVQTMHESGFTLWLGVTADEAALRIPNTESRPLFKDLNTARATLARRLPLYKAAASSYIDTTGLSIAKVSSLAKDILEEQGILYRVTN